VLEDTDRSPVPERAQEPADEQQVVVVHPDRLAGSDKPGGDTRERGVRLRIRLPVGVRILHTTRKRVEERPQRAIAESVVIATMPLRRKIHRGEREAFDHVEPLGTGDALGARLPTPAQPDTLARLQDRAQGRHESADIPLAWVRRCVGRTEVRQPIGEDQQVIRCAAHAHGLRRDGHQPHGRARVLLATQRNDVAIEPVDGLGTFEPPLRMSDP